MPTERDLEEDLARDISRVSPDWLVIGRQVRTDFGGFIDLLCIDKDGCTVVIELKKERTPREVTAQTLDYASWAKGLSSEQLTKIAGSYLSPRTGLKDSLKRAVQRLAKNAGSYLSPRTGPQDSLKRAFQRKFGKRPPQRLNKNHRSIIVVGVVDASKQAVDSGTERIVNYLTELGVPIAYRLVPYPDARPENEGRRLAIIGDLSEDRSGGVRAIRSAPRDGKTGYKTIRELLAMADESGIGDLYRQVKKGVRGTLSAQPYGWTVGYRARRPAENGGGVRTVMFIRAIPGDGGGLSFTLHATRFRTILGIQLRELRKCLPRRTRVTDVSGWVGASKDEKRRGRGLEGEFRSTEEVAKFISLFRESRAAN